MDPSRNHLRPAIVRIWRGRTTGAKAEEYHRYLYEHGSSRWPRRLWARRCCARIVRTKASS
jgi:hypothetical protein